MGFDRVAGIYRALEKVAFGGALQRARVEHLDLSGETRVLLLGDGDGRFLEALLACAPDARVDVVEASAEMIGLARQRTPEGSAVVFHHLDVMEFEPSGRYDLVASHFFLDCFDEGGVTQIVGRVAACLADGGGWLISDFQMPESGLLRRLRAGILLRIMYCFFRITSDLGARALVDPDAILRSAGFSLQARAVSNFGFVRSDRWGS